MKTNVMDKLKSKEAAVFHVCYRIGGEKPGEPVFTMELIVNASPGNPSMAGHGTIFQAVSPPEKVETDLKGAYSPEPGIPESHWLVHLTGYEKGGFPMPIQNAEVWMRMSRDWREGMANYTYLVNGKWKQVDDAKVQAVDCITV